MITIPDERTACEPHGWYMGEGNPYCSSVRSAMETLLLNAGTHLGDEAFRTFMTEAECIVNSRPLSTNDLNDPGYQPNSHPAVYSLSNQRLYLRRLQGRSREQICRYARKWWRRVQCLANKFWLRWRHEFLQSLQSRNKWMYPRRIL